MRAAQDLNYKSFLKRVRNRQINEDDIQTLNFKVIINIFTTQLFHSTILIQLNDDRHCLNHVCLEQFARDLKELIYIFPSEHDRIQGMNYSPVEALIIPDGKGVSCPGLFYYTPGMKGVIQVNVDTKNGIVNGTTGTITNVLVGEEGALYLFS